MKQFRKPYRIKRKKSILRSRFFRLGILILILVGSIFYSLFFLEIFQGEIIIITGEKKVLKKDIELLIEGKLENKILFLKTKSIFLLNLNEAERDVLKEFPQIAEVKISRGFPDTVNVVVIERKGIAIWCQARLSFPSENLGGQGDCFLFDNKGIIFEEASVETDLIKIIDEQNMGDFSLGERVIEKEKLAKILKIKTKLGEDLKILTEEIAIISDERLNVKTSEGWEIYFDPKGDLDWQIIELDLVLEKQIPPKKREELEYIDLRFSRVYYK